MIKIKKLEINFNNRIENQQIYKITEIKNNISRNNIRRKILKIPLSPLNTKILNSQCSYKILNPIKIRNHSHNNNLIGLILNQSVDLELERKRQMEDFENRYRKIKLEEEKKQRLIEKIMYQKIWN